MSTFSPGSIHCGCGHAYTVDVADGLHVSLRPDLRQAILDGTFHRFACPSCGRRSTVEKLLAYTDFPRRQWFTVVPRLALARRSEWLRLAERSFRATMVEHAAPIAKAWAPDMIRRVIFGMASLREKLVAFEAGLDDRWLEFVKLEIIYDGTVPVANDGYFHFTSVRGPDLVFEWALPGNPGTTEMVVPRALYDDLQAGAEANRARAHGLFDSSIVDCRTYFVADEAAAVHEDVA